MNTTHSDSCPCGSGQVFGACCGPYLSGREKPPTAEALMRSRYTAFVQNDTAYIARTGPTEKKGADEEAGELPNNLEWLGLEICATSQGMENDTQGKVEFIARYRVGENAGQMHEISRFARVDGNWRYTGGVVIPEGQVRGAPKVGRNDPCPCGSGKKYKKCCGA
jgi:SEC-C motif-containing protein